MLVFARTALAVLIPLSGFTVMRAWLGEAKAISAIAGGAVLGLGMFWLALRVLASFIPFESAAWFAFAAVVVCGGLSFLNLLRRETPRAMERTGRLARLGLLAFAIIFAVSVYAASASLFRAEETMTIHLPLVASIQRGNFPPVDLREPNHPFEYHWGQHLLAAGIAQIAGVQSWLALFFSNALLAGLAFLLAYSIARREVGRFGAAIAGVMATVGGTLNWLSASQFTNSARDFAELMNPLGYPFTTGNVIVGGFFWRLHANSSTWPFCLLLLGIELLWRGARDTRPLLFLIPAALLLAMVAPSSETMFCVGIAGVLAGVALARLGRTALSWRRVSLLVLVAVAAIALAPFMGGVLRSFLQTGSASHQAKILVNTQHFGSVRSLDFVPFFRDSPWLPIFSWRFLQDAGPVPWLLVPVLSLAAWRSAWRMSCLALVALAGLVAATTFTLTQIPHDTFRLVNHATVIGAIPVGAFLGELVTNVRVNRVRLLFVGLLTTVVATLVTAWPLSHLGINRVRDRFAWPTQLEFATVYDERAIGWLQTRTNFQDGIVTIPLERWNILGSGQTTPTGSKHSGGPEYRGKAQAAVSRFDLRALSALGVKYLYVAGDGVPLELRAQIDTAADNGTLEFQLKGSSGVIYSLVPAEL